MRVILILMIINQSTEWKPRTYYILENICSGKKYIGQTTTDINTYLGSGSYWIPHCKKHGGYNRDNISIVHSKLYESKEEAQQFLDEFNETNVDYWQTSNKEWANLCEENTEDSPFVGGALARQMVADGRHNFLGGEIQRRSNLKRVADGTHPFLGGEHARQMVADGRHPFLGGEIQRRSNLKRVADGTHPFLGGEIVRKRVADGTHHFLGGEIQRRWHAEKFADGTHHLMQTHICPHCKKEGKGPNMHRYHFDKCKLRNWSNIFDE